MGKVYGTFASRSAAISLNGPPAAFEGLSGGMPITFSRAPATVTTPSEPTVFANSSAVTGQSRIRQSASSCLSSAYSMSVRAGGGGGGGGGSSGERRRRRRLERRRRRRGR